jgi:hypothetical protein
MVQQVTAAQPAHPMPRRLHSRTLDKSLVISAGITWALALCSGVSIPSVTTAMSVHRKTATVISSPQLPGWSCGGLLALSTLLYPVGRYQNARFSIWDILRALIPSALAAWMLVQNPGVFDMW